ncbi:hypothetical protein ACFSSA_06335 [Luteolibacter algae]|uniref:Uncharacterized protein n=1 Tax=Luteolibacter algae TaxID=454151 RepID=A0ABW5D7D4_9BACT
MKVSPTMEGGLRIDPESPQDWHALRAIIMDANNCEKDLAERMGGLVSDEKLREDWQDLVVPDLRESFGDAIHYVYASIEAAAAFSGGGDSPLWITREDATSWYSALNQARLSLEEKYQFGPEPEDSPESTSLVRREALMRSQFYCALQSFILEHAMTL